MDIVHRKKPIEFLPVHRVFVLHLRPNQTANVSEPPLVQTFLAKQLQLPQTERLFLYCDSAFSPVPTEPVGHLYACFGRGGELIVNYATTGAYG